MPRQSAAARGASLYLAGTKPLPIPKSLVPEVARVIWRATVNSRPADFFAASDVELLTRYCSLAARAQLLEAVLAGLSVEDPDAVGVERRLTAMSLALGTLASRLRITATQRIERHSAHRDEPGRVLDPLLGPGARLNA